MKSEIDAYGDEGEAQYGGHEQRLGVFANVLHHYCERVEVFSRVSVSFVE